MLQICENKKKYVSLPVQVIVAWFAFNNRVLFDDKLRQH